MFILPHGTWKDNIRIINLDWRQRSDGHESKHATCLLRHTKIPRHRRNICANSLGLYSYNTQLSPTKNKNMIYISIYLRFFRCLSNFPIYNKATPQQIVLWHITDTHWRGSYSPAEMKTVYSTIYDQQFDRTQRKWVIK